MNDKMLSRIKKLLALGDKERGATDAEAETAMGLAKDLMTEHNITMSDLEVEALSKAPIDKQEAISKRSIHTWEYRLFNVCDVLFGVSHYTSRCMGKKKIIFFGLREDVVLSMAVYPILYKTCLKMSSSYSYVDRNAYLDGLTHCLLSRAKEFRPIKVTPQQPLTPEQQSKTCTAIMVVKQNVIQDMFADIGLVNRSPKRKDRRGSPVFAQGVSDGRHVNLSFQNKLT